MHGDEDEDRDMLLKSLSGDVDDYAGSQLKDPEAKEGPAGGVTVTISVSPNGEVKKEEDAETPEEEKEEHDPIAHVLGMCGGGCPG
jgi:hypothetical protein